ncbi:MAG: NUDIX domain-containing protein [Anaerolineae bacterium]|nr:NUDIX domain-containing protein [Anaerolineae bacterium]
MKQVNLPFVAVGAAVVRNDRVLFVRQTYPPFAGQWVVPAGLPEPGETVDETIRRELGEEASIEAQVVGLVGLTSVVAPPPPHISSHVFIVFLCRPTGDAEPVADGVENDAAAYFSLEELAALEEPVEPQSRRIAERVLRGEYQVLPPADLQSGTIFTEVTAWM